MIGKKSEVPLGAGTGVKCADWLGTDIRKLSGVRVMFFRGICLSQVYTFSKLSDFTLFEIPLFRRTCTDVWNFLWNMSKKSGFIDTWIFKWLDMWQADKINVNDRI